MNRLGLLLPDGTSKGKDCENPGNKYQAKGVLTDGSAGSLQQVGQQFRGDGLVPVADIALPISQEEEHAYRREDGVEPLWPKKVKVLEDCFDHVAASSIATCPFFSPV